MTLCLASTLCVDYDRRAEAPALAEDGPLCEGCLTAGERAPDALVADYVALEQQVPKPISGRGDGQPSGSGESPIPLRPEVVDLQLEICWVMVAWAEVIRDVRMLSDPSLPVVAHWTARAPRAKDGVDLQRAARILGAHGVIRRVAKLEPHGFWDYPGSSGWSEVDGAQGVLDLVDLHSRAQGPLGLNRPRPEICWGVECPNPQCNLVNTLTREQGEDTVRCGACGYRYQADEYKRWVGLLAESVRSREVA